MTQLVRFQAEHFRSLYDAVLRPGRMCALVGEARAGKSNVLAAIRALLDPNSAPLETADASVGASSPVRLHGELADGTVITLEGPPPATATVEGGEAPAALFLPASLRSDGLVAPLSDPRGPLRLAASALMDPVASLPGDHSTTEAARSLIAGLEECCAAGIDGIVLLIEEPELFLPPQSGRYLYRLLADFAARGNQVIYSTHSPAFVNMIHFDELVFTERHSREGTILMQPERLDPGELLRASSEFDAERSELFFARGVVLVEGITEKLILPYLFRALGHDPDRVRISVVECGGKSKIPLFVRVCREAGIPFIAVHDRDASPGEEPIQGERHLNDLIAETAGTENTIVLEPDFERAAGLRESRDDKVARAWHHFRDMPADEVPELLVEVVERALRLVGD
jgi:predicted ATP-dependent endonuclease of OLD family